MKTLIIFMIALFFSNPITDISSVRKMYARACTNKEYSEKLYTELASITKKDHKTLVAYKGAVMALIANYKTSNKEKNDFFKEGVAFIEFAVQAEPENIEIRCIRLSIQENSPKILRYRDALENDKTFIIKNYTNTSNPEIKGFVKGYVLQSSIFTADEKKAFN